MSKEEYIGKYLDRKMKHHDLPYSFEYLDLVGRTEEAAEKSWARRCKKIKKELNK